MDNHQRLPPSFTEADAVDGHLPVNSRPITTFHVFDSSRLWTFFIAISLVVYGSLRSMRVEQQEGNDEKTSTTTLPTTVADDDDGPSLQTIDACQAAFLPFGASASLLCMFYFFDSLQLIVTVSTAVLATVAFAFLLIPVCQCLLKPCGAFVTANKVSVCCIGRYTPAHVLAVMLSVLLVAVWVATGHWLLMDMLGMSLCVSFIAFIRLPSLKVSTLLLVGLLFYDLFWVFFSSYIFSTNVMMKMATKSAENPVTTLVRRLKIHPSGSYSPKLSLPGKLVFPSMHSSGNYSMLGLGDIVMPGLLVCFVMRYDLSRKANAVLMADAGVPGPASYYQRIKYFHCSLVGYFIGLLTATVSSEVFNAAQPALIYLVPFTLLPLIIMAYLRGDLRRMWSTPFQAAPLPKFLSV